MNTGEKKRNNRKVGTFYEQIAGKYLESIGCQIVQYNYRCKAGEIDIIAQDGEYLVFCEVKYRSDHSKGMPSEAVNYRKQKVLSKCALFYITTHHKTRVPCRFDVIGILGDKNFHDKTEIRHYKNAFLYTG